MDYRNFIPGGVRLTPTIVACLTAFHVAPAQAQSEAQARSDETGPENVLEEVVVTAQWRPESLQSVPIAISALSSEDLEVRGIESPEGLQLSVPNLNLGQQAGNGWTNVVATIRGVGTVNALLDPGVPMHVDGHYMQATAMLARDFLDVERVEVLRGPQGTLYGRNAIGGSINIVSKRPTEEFEGQFVIDAGNFNKRLIQGVVSGPLGAGVRGRLAVADGIRDGYVENVSPVGAEDYQNADYTTVRGSLDIDLTDTAILRLSAYYYDSKMNTISFRRFNPYPELGVSSSADYYVLNGAGTNPTVDDRYEVKLNNPGDTHDEAVGFSADFDWVFEAFEFRSLTAYNDSQTIRWADIDASDVISATTYTDLPMETFTQEFQFLLNNDGPLRGQMGVFYYYQDSPLFTEFANDNTVANLYELDTPRAIFQETYEWEVQSLGVYGQLEYDLSDALTLVVGGRYTNDEKDQVSVSGGNFDGLLDLETVVLDEGWDQFTYRAALNYQLTDNAMAYASYATGYKAGGIFILSTYEPEFVNAIEFGLKSDWFDRRLRINAALFHSDYKDKQERIRVEIDGVLTPGGMIQNIPNTIIQGLELEGQALLGNGFSVDASLTWQDSEYDGIVIEDPLGPGGRQDISGNQLPNSAEWRGYLGVQHQQPIRVGGQLMLRADISYVGEMHGSIYNYDQDVIPSYEWINLRARWQSDNGDLMAELYVNNALDEDAMTGHAYVPYDEFGYPDLGEFLPPRTYGIRLTRNF